jgi:hypothetical protein
MAAHHQQQQQQQKRMLAHAVSGAHPQRQHRQALKCCRHNLLHCPIAAAAAAASHGRRQHKHQHL